MRWSDRPGTARRLCGPPRLSPGVVVMDVLMPNKDGVEACWEIMLTASTEEAR